MAVTNDDVRHIAMLARLGVDESRMPSLVAELNGILGHMEVLSRVDTARVRDGQIDASSAAVSEMWLRPDEGPPLPLLAPRESFAPQVRDGLLLVPRLATHVDEPEESA